jgi:hypothetical protein
MKPALFSPFAVRALDSGATVTPMIRAPKRFRYGKVDRGRSHPA